MSTSLQSKNLPLDAVSVVRKSFDARVKQRNFVYVVDVDSKAATAAGAAPRFKQGQIERWLIHNLIMLFMHTSDCLQASVACLPVIKLMCCSHESFCGNPHDLVLKKSR